MKTFSNNKSPGNDGLIKKNLWNFLGRTEATIHEFVKPNKSEQKDGHIPKARSSKIIRIERQR